MIVDRVELSCLDFRRALGANPNDTSAQLAEHRAQCPACERYAQEMLSLDGLIKKALHVSVPEMKTPSMQDVDNVVALPVRPRVTRWYAMAASVTVIIGAALGAVWMLSFSRDTLAQDVVQHMQHEISSMTPAETRVATELLEGVLKAKGLRLVGPLNNVSYLMTCELRGHLVPHLVVQTDQGPVTVILLTEETVTTKRVFDEQQYHGVLVPAAHGALAVIATDAALVEAVAAQVNAAVG